MSTTFDEYEYDELLRSGGVLRTYHHFGQPHGYLHLWKAHGMSCSNPFRRNSAHPEIVQLVTKQAPFQQVQTATTSFLCLTRKVGKPSNPSKSCISMQCNHFANRYSWHSCQTTRVLHGAGASNIGAMDSGLDPDLVQRLRRSGFVVVFPGRLTDGHMILVDYYLLQDMLFWIILICFIIGRFFAVMKYVIINMIYIIWVDSHIARFSGNPLRFPHFGERYRLPASAAQSPTLNCDVQVDLKIGLDVYHSTFPLIGNASSFFKYPTWPLQ